MATGDHVFGWVDKVKYIPNYNEDAAEDPSLEYTVRTNHRVHTFIDPEHLVSLKRVLPKHEMSYIIHNT